MRHARDSKTVLRRELLSCRMERKRREPLREGRRNRQGLESGSPSSMSPFFQLGQPPPEGLGILGSSSSITSFACDFGDIIDPSESQFCFVSL